MDENIHFNTANTDPMKERESLVDDADVERVCEAAEEYAKHLRWLGYAAHVEKAAEIYAAVARIREGKRGW